MSKTRLVVSCFLVAAIGCGGGQDADEGSEHTGQPLTALKLEDLSAPKNAPSPDAPAGSEAFAEKACGLQTPASKIEGPLDGVAFGSYATCYDMCPAGSFVYQFAVRDEDEQGSGDDTAINTIDFACFDRTTGQFTQELLSKQGFYGDWYISNIAGSTDDPAVGADVWQVPSQGSRDDAGMLMLQLHTRLGNSLSYSSLHFTSQGETLWQTVSQHATCPSGQAICGLETRVEPKRGTTVDDTTLNGLRLACCNF